MKKLPFSILFLLVSIFSFSQKNSASNSINSFSFKVFEQVYSANENCFYSPYSIFGALSLTYEGAENKTKLEMAKVLEINSGDKTSEDFLKVNNSLRSSKDFKLLTANSIWLQNSFKLKKSYKKISSDYYDATTENVDFIDETSRENARNEINKWVEKQTNNNIKDFIKKGILTESTAMVLINAVYFNALWKNDFSSSEISFEDFIAASGDSIHCEMMNTYLNTKYYQDEEIQAIEVPYENNGASMLILLPKKSTENIFKEVDGRYYSEIITSLEAKNVKLSIPKFKLSVNYELSDVMKNLGMKSAFSREADFSGITGSKDLIVSNILHQSVIDVSEKGTEASSTTAVISMRSTVVNKDIPIIFKADRPFLFIIKENITNAILFMGYLTIPTKAKKNVEIQKPQNRE
ncbi:MAG: serpin family protein, partial [Bacteroidales bacterium]|nr:serpin family protein [Bacteroidales bacterium]